MDIITSMTSKAQISLMIGLHAYVLYIIDWKASFKFGFHSRWTSKEKTCQTALAKDSETCQAGVRRESRQEYHHSGLSYPLGRLDLQRDMTSCQGQSQTMTPRLESRSGAGGPVQNPPRWCFVASLWQSGHAQNDT